jgi:hypothetical protein
MSQERLEDLMILAVEAERSQTIDIQHIRETFFNKQETARR